MKKYLHYLQALCCLSVVVFALMSCVDTPSKPIHNNPFDPLNPDTHGDPYNLSASLVDSGILLEWDAVDWQPLTGYSVLRSCDDEDAFAPLAQVGIETVSLTDREVADGHCYQYHVVVRYAEGNGDLTGLAPAVMRTHPGIIIENDSAEFTATRDVTLQMQAFGASQMLLSNDAEFTDAEWESFAETKDWQLTTGAGEKTVYLRVIYTSGETSDAVQDAILTTPPDAPLIVIAHDSTYTSTRNVELTIIALGAIEMQLSNSPFTGEETWVNYAERVDWELEIGTGTKIVYLKVRDEFLVETEASDQIEPAALNPNLRILPDSTYINHTDVVLSMPNTGALEMKVSNTPDSSNTIWFNCVESMSWILSSGDGWKRVYGWFRNDFNTDEAVSDSIGLDTQASIASFDWSSNGGDVLVPGDSIFFTMQATDDAFGAETGGSAVVMVDGWDGINLTGQGDGFYIGSYTITTETPEVAYARVIVSFIDRGGNVMPSETADEQLTAEWHSADDEQDFPLGNTGQTITMCWIPAGSFDMGSPDAEQDREANEGPVHRVTFARGFWMSRFEITQGQWQAVMGSNPSSDFGVGAGLGENNPVYYVSWDHIQDFEAVLGGAFRLPSESEWEYACRASATTRFYWGDDENYDAYAWYGDNSISSGTHPVGQKTANSWGLCDMSGNVSEWCEDWSHNNYIGAPIDGSAWLLPVGHRKIIRGGSFDLSWSCRSAARAPTGPGSRSRGIGFRLVRDAGN